MENQVIVTSNMSHFYSLKNVERIYSTIDRCKDDWFNLVCIMRGEWRSKNDEEISLMEDALQFIHRDQGELNVFKDTLFIL